MIKHTVYRDDEEVILTVDFDYSPPDRGRREHGIQMEPDSPEEIEIISAKDVNGKDIKLTDIEKDEIMDAISLDIRERRDEAAIARYESIHERSRETGKIVWRIRIGNFENPPYLNKKKFRAASCWHAESCGDHFIDIKRIDNNGYWKNSF
jgi:hypothetical protein